VLAALAAPTALCGLDGAVMAANAPWRAAFGAGRRPSVLGNLFAAFQAARRDGRGVGRMTLDGTERHITVAAVAADRFLLTLETTAAAGPAHVAAAVTPTAAPAMDVFAAASPFGAALIAGPDPFTGEITAVNPSLGRIAGPPALPGVTLQSLLTQASAREAAASYAQRREGPFEVALAAAPERTAHLYLADAPGGAVAYLQDVTDQKQMQAQLAQRNKMESIGQLAGGVAHDFNNLLSAIRLRAEELLQRHSLGDPSYESLAEIRQTVDRAADVVRQLLTFSRKATIQRETLDLGEALTHAEVLLRRLLRENVKLTIEYGQGLPRVRIDRSQLETAVMNLVVNARDAVQSKGGGAVRIRAARLSEPQAAALGYGGLVMGELALIEVADDGPGIPPNLLAHIFEPFFTTKPVGEGTGLGLATVYGVVKQADGWISVASTPGEGAIFRIFLPVHAPPLALEPPPTAKTRAAPRDLSGVGRILFVEDEPLVRGVAARLLRGRGYEVIEAADGEAALDLAKAHAGAIDLMISDVIMPGMDGPALLKAARPYLGAAPVMFISGYAEAEFSDLLEGESGVSFLPKPLDIASLAERVKAHLRPPERVA
jgi:two-component system cell cycle sensor histidine kinase/response regulator CckA